MCDLVLDSEFDETPVDIIEIESKIRSDSYCIVNRCTCTNGACGGTDV